MRSKSQRAAWTAAIAVIAIAVASFMLPGDAGLPSAHAEENAVTFPPLEQLEHYTTVRRGMTREHMLTNRSALDAIKDGLSVPTGTHVVLVDYQSDVLERYLVAQKTGDGIDDWQYQWFRPDGSVKADENVERCYSCHQRSRQDRQFMFTYSDAVEFE